MTKHINLYLFVWIISLALIGYGYYSLYSKIKQTNKISAEVEYFSQSTASLSLLKSRLPELSSVLGKWLASLPSNENEVVKFASATEAIAKSRNIGLEINFDDFPTTVDIGGREVSGLGADITITGGSQNSLFFLNDLEKLPYFYKTDKITIVKQENKSGIKTVINGTLLANFEKK